MASPPPPAGWSRYLVKGTLGAGQHFVVLGSPGKTPRASTLLT